MGEEKKEGVSIREIEEFAKQHRSKLLLTVVFAMAALFGLWGAFKPGWCVMLGMGAAILGYLAPLQTMNALRKVFQFVIKQENAVRFTLCAIIVLLACFVPFSIFVLVGSLGGSTVYQIVNGS